MWEYQDCPCGSTIGPAIAALTGIRTVDVGISSLSMHSIRETIGVEDIDNSIKLFKVFYKNFRESTPTCPSAPACPLPPNLLSCTAEAVVCAEEALASFRQAHVYTLLNIV